MTEVSKKHSKMFGYIAIIVAIMLLITSYAYADLRSKKIDLEKKLSETEGTLKITEEGLVSATEKSNYLESELTLERNKNNEFQEKIGKIAGTVGTLEKLSQTDRELLQKYSKVFFLNEHYAPKELVSVPDNYVYQKNKAEYFNSRAWTYLKKLLDNAASSGNDIKIISAYRSFSTQVQVKTGYKVLYGSGANQFSADQGYSEHQLGTAVDFTTGKLGTSFTDFDETQAYTWLTANAHRYGFILSYPKNNAYYQFEPWHWRFVGVELATKLHNENKFFYDEDQRVIDTFLVNIFD